MSFKMDMMATQSNRSSCIVCSEAIQDELISLFDTRFGIDGDFSVAVCGTCGLEQTVTNITQEQLTHLYESYYNFGGEKNTLYTRLRSRLYRSTLYRAWLRIDGDVAFHLRKGTGRLLDIGCNEGRGLEFFRRAGFDPEGLELNRVAADNARAKGFTVHNVSLEEFFPEKCYDYAVMSNVLEHSLDPKSMLSNLNRLLRDGGIVYISCPNNNSWARHLFAGAWINWHVPFHISHFSSATISNLLESTGFKVRECRQATPSLWIVQSILAKIFAEKGSKTTQLRSPLLVPLLILVVRLLMFPVLWVGNATGRGDCLVLVAEKVDVAAS